MKHLALIAALFSAVLVVAPVQAAPKQVPKVSPTINKPKAASPYQPAVKAPNIQPTPADPAQVTVERPDSPLIPQLGQATMDTSPSVSIAVDQSPIPTVNTPAVAGGLSNYFVQPAAALLQVNIANGAHQVYKVRVTNNSSAAGAYIRLYNAGTGFAGCNSATNLIYEAQIPAAAAANLSGILDDNWGQGMGGFVSGLSICVSGAYGTTDVSVPPASALNVNVGYK